MALAWVICLLKHDIYFLLTRVVAGSQDLWVTCGYES